MTASQVFGKRLQKQFTRRKVMKMSTVRDFGGGLNVIDSDLNLSSRFAKVLKNIYRQPDGSNGLRCGTRVFARVASVVTGDILNITYFAGYLIGFTTTGQGVKIDGTGTVTKIWDDTIANALPDNPDGWSTDLTVVNFAQFKGDLIVVNGVDKPLIVDKDGTVAYLQDIPTTSNINVPICKYVCAVGEWLVMAGLTTGDTQDEGTVYISNTQTSGTWPGDQAPNDAVTYQVFAAASIGSAKITGLGAYRGRLLVMFQSVCVTVRLGSFENDVHAPAIEDVFTQFGSISHRSLSDLGYDILFADVRGVASITQAAISSALDPNRKSELIDPNIQSMLSAISSEQQLANVFSVYHALEGLYMLFVPNGSTWAETTQTTCFAYHSTRSAKNRNGWAEFHGWKFRAGCRSDGGRLFFANESTIYIMGDARFDDEFYADYVDDYDTSWAVSTVYTVGDRVRDPVDDTVYRCISDHTSSATGTLVNDNDLYNVWEVYDGEAIEFDWEFPWADFDQRMISKELRYVQLDTVGNASFTCEIYVDNFRRSNLDGSDIPALSMDFVGGSSGGFGAGDQPYGGGRRTVEERAWPMNHRFKIMKLRLKGSTTSSLGLRVVSISFGYIEGSILR